MNESYFVNVMLCIENRSDRTVYCECYMMLCCVCHCFTDRVVLVDVLETADFGDPAMEPSRGFSSKVV